MTESALYDVLWAALAAADLLTAVADIEVGIEAFLTPAGPMVSVTVWLRPDASRGDAARVHERILRVCWAQGAIPSIALV